MTYTTGPYELLADQPAPTVSRWHSSDAIDYSAGRLVIDSDGNADGMDDTAHLVMGALLSVDMRPGGAITDRRISGIKNGIRSALAPLADLIRVERVDVLELRPGVLTPTVDYTTLRTGERQTVTRAHS